MGVFSNLVIKSKAPAPPAGQNILPVDAGNPSPQPSGKYRIEDVLKWRYIPKKTGRGIRKGVSKTGVRGWIERGSNEDEILRGLDAIIFAHRLYKAYGKLGRGRYNSRRIMEIPTVERIWNGPGWTAGIGAAFGTDVLKAIATSEETNWAFGGASMGMEERTWHDSALVDAFDEIDIPQGVTQVTKAIWGAIQDAVLGSENTNDDPSLFTKVDADDQNYTLSVVKLERGQTWSGEMIEDHSGSLDEQLDDHLVSHARAREDAIINGSDDGTHPDTDTEAGAATLAAKAFDGLMHRFNTANSNEFNNLAGPFTRDTHAEMLKITGVDYVKNLILLLAHRDGVALYQDSDTNLVHPSGVTVSFEDRGTLAQSMGHPIIVSAKQRIDVDATGVNGASGNNFSRPILFNPKAFVIGRKRDLTLDIEKKPGADAVLLSSHERMGFSYRAPSADDVGAMARNVSA